MPMLKLLDVVPSWIWAIVCAGLLSFSGVSYVRMVKAQGDLATYQAEIAQALAAARDQALKREREINGQMQRAQNESKQRETVLRADADAARAERDGLRDDIAAGSRSVSDDPRGAIVERADTYGKLLGQCAKALEEMAGRCDRHVNDLQTMTDSWPK